MATTFWGVWRPPSSFVSNRTLSTTYSTLTLTSTPNSWPSSSSGGNWISKRPPTSTKPSLLSLYVQVTTQVLANPSKLPASGIISSSSSLCASLKWKGSSDSLRWIWVTSYQTSGIKIVCLNFSQSSRCTNRFGSFSPPTPVPKNWYKISKTTY